MMSLFRAYEKMTQALNIYIECQGIFEMSLLIQKNFRTFTRYCFSEKLQCSTFNFTSRFYFYKKVRQLKKVSLIKVNYKD